MCSVLHHVEICIGEESNILNLLIKGFGFTPFAQHQTPLSSKLALRCDSIIFVVTQRKEHQSRNDGHHVCSELIVEPHSDSQSSSESSLPLIKSSDEHIDPEPWTVFCCQEQISHITDSAFNVALLVKDVDEVTKRVRAQGGRLIKEPTNVADDHGQVRYSIVTSCCGNIVHTIIDKRNYSGEFLPRFKKFGPQDNNLDAIINESQLSEKSSFMKENTLVQKVLQQADIWSTTNCLSLQQNGASLYTHVDHIAYVCEAGQSKELMTWYENCFGMKRFKTNREDSDEDGVVLGGDIGLRLKAMEYWKCAEVGLAMPSSSMGDTTLKLVIAEPLVGHDDSHVNTFLHAHKGPGVQHIGLHTSDIAASVKYSALHGITFRKPPSVYYESVKLEEIKAAGHEGELDLFRELGILLDTEADVFSDMEEDQGKKKYLLQVFTVPVFKEDTFFLEAIQRHGAKGFGAGNITALAHSIILHREKMRQASS